MLEHLSASVLGRSTQLRFLQYFVCVAEELNFSRAAEQLHVSQPSLSRQIRLLESRLGGPLFERTHRRVQLTDIGALFLVEARAALERFDHAMAIGRQAARGELGTLRIAYASAAIFNVRTSQLIAEFAAAWPGVELRTEQLARPEVLQAVNECNADIGIVHSDNAAAGCSSPPVLHAELLDEEGMVVGMHRAHRLAGSDSVPLEDIVDEAFFSMRNSDAYGLTGPLARLAALRGAPVRIALQVQSAPAMVYMAAQGLGLALLPASMTSLNAPGIHYVRLVDAGPPRRLTVVHRDGHLTAAMRNFLGLVREIREAEPAAPQSAPKASCIAPAKAPP